MALFERKKVRVRDKIHGEVSFSRQIIRGVVRLLIIAFVVCLIWYITRLQAFTIHDVVVEGGETISHDEIRSKILDELQGSYFLIIPKRFTYFYPHDRMMSIFEKIPRAYNISISLLSRNILHVSFDEHIPYGLWCAYEKNDIPCYFIDASGYAFSPAPHLEGGTLIRYSIEDTDEINAGNVIDEAKLHAIDSFIKHTDLELGFRITALVYRKNGDIEFTVNGGGMIFVTGGKDFEATFENLRTVLASKEFKHIKPGNFKYIDVRFDNKVFVNEELTPTATTTESIATTSVAQ